jgi:hypothetical protein
VPGFASTAAGCQRTSTGGLRPTVHTRPRRPPLSVTIFTQAVTRTPASRSLSDCCPPHAFQVRGSAFTVGRRRPPGSVVRAPSPSAPVPGTMAWPARRVIWTPALTITPSVHAHIGGQAAGLLTASLVQRLPGMRKHARGRLVQVRVRNAHRGSPLLGSSVRCGYLYYRPGWDPWSLGRLPSCSWPMQTQQPQPLGPLHYAPSEPA